MGELKLGMDSESYLEFERRSQTKHELWDGEVFAMSGASLAHNRIVRNLIQEIGLGLHSGDCEALPSDMRVRIPAHARYVYPDVSIVCGLPQLEDAHGDILLNPRTIIEVLSDSTAAFDRGDKFTGYRSIPSVKEVLFVHQDRAEVELYARQDDGSWLLREYRDNDKLPLAPLSAPLPLSAIYAKVSFQNGLLG